MTDIDKVIDTLDRKLWKLHERLGQGYDGADTMLRDAVKLGRLGTKLLKLREARRIMNELDAKPDAKAEE